MRLILVWQGTMQFTPPKCTINCMFSRAYIIQIEESIVNVTETEKHHDQEC